MKQQHSQESIDGSFSLRAIVEALLRHKKKAVFFVASVLAMATLILLFAPRRYRSEARLFVQVGRESVRLDPTATTGNTIALQQSGRDAEIATVMEILRSRAIVEKTVDALKPEVVLGEVSLDGDLDAQQSTVAEVVMAPVHYLIGLVKSIDPISKREEAIILIERNLEVDAEHDSTLVSLTYDGETAPLAQSVLDKLVDIYRDEHVRLHQTKGSKPFFIEQRQELEQKLVAAENAYKAAKTRMAIASIDARRNTLENQLGTIELTRNSTIQSMAATESRIAALKDHTSAIPDVLKTSTTVMPNTGADQLRSQLYSLQVTLMNLESRYNNDHPLVQAAREQVDEAKRTLGEESDSRTQTTDSLNENHRQLSLELAQAESQLAGLKAQKSELDSQRESVQTNLLKLNDYEIELADLDREMQLAKQNYSASAIKFEQARIDEALDNQRITNIAVAQPATLAEKPVSPSKLIIAALSIVLLGAGTPALVLAAEKVNPWVWREDQVEHLMGLPVLASVPEGRDYGTMPRAIKTAVAVGQ
jgi:polysaccharide biosynthesis protein PslE